MSSVATDVNAGPVPDRRAKALQDYRKKLLEHREFEAKLKDCKSQG